MLVKRQGQKMEFWVDDQPQSWYHTKTRKLWECIKDEFKVNTDLASGHFQNNGVVQISLDFRRALAIECLKNTIGVDLGKNGRPKRTSKIPNFVPSKKVTVRHHGKMRDPSKKSKK